MRFQGADESDRLTRLGHEVVPAPRDDEVIGKLKRSVSNGIAAVEIVEQPAVNPLFREPLLDLIDLHMRASRARRSEMASKCSTTCRSMKQRSSSRRGMCRSCGNGSRRNGLPRRNQGVDQANGVPKMHVLVDHAVDEQQVPAQGWKHVSAPS